MNENLPEWGNDELSEYFRNTEENARASKANLPNDYKRLVDADKAFLSIIRGLDNNLDVHLSSFLVRAHSCIRSASRSALSGQVPEVYMLCRGAIENAVYALFIQADQTRYLTWANREDSSEAKRACRKMFSITAVLKDIEPKLDANIFKIVNELYERSIDSGAHPNALSHFSGIEIVEDGDKTEYRFIYLHNDPVNLSGMTKEASRYALATLRIFEAVFPSIYKSMDLSRQLDALGVHI